MPARLPRTVKVGPHLYTIRRFPVSEGENAQMFGYMRPDLCEIGLMDGLPASRLLETLVHELAHALLASGNVQAVFDDQQQLQEEPFVHSLSFALTALLLDNPRLVAWANAQLELIRKEARQ